MMGPYIIQTNKQNAQQVGPGIPNMKMLANQLGSSSATNKAKKAFNFELDVQQKTKQKGKGASAVNYSNKSKQALNVTKGAQNGNQAASINSNKKLVMQNKAKLKTQMNLTGPLPKNILSPKSMANKSHGKSKHSQYFNNEAEIAAQASDQMVLSTQ